MTQNCKNCEARRIECHINCPIYAEQVRENARAREQRKKEAEIDNQIYNIRRAIKKARGRKKL